MKHFLAALGLAAAIAAPIAAHAGSTGRLDLSGTVLATCDVTIDRSDVQFNPRAGVSSLRVASVTERCNSVGGYQVTISSANSGVLRGTEGSTAGYTMAYGDVVSKASSPVVVNRAVDAAGRSRDLMITMPAQPGLRAGTYQDTLVLTVAGK